MPQWLTGKELDTALARALGLEVHEGADHPAYSTDCVASSYLRREMERRGYRWNMYHTPETGFVARFCPTRYSYGSRRIAPTEEEATARAALAALTASHGPVSRPEASEGDGVAGRAAPVEFGSFGRELHRYPRCGNVDNHFNGVGKMVVNVATNPGPASRPVVSPADRQYPAAEG